jgi:predicted nucleic acid-binding protein
MQYLVDTGIWLRLFDRTDPEHAAIRDALRALRSSGHTLAACPQNIAEFWNVATRPTSARGGYGKSVPMTERRVQFIERTSTILAESPAAYRQPLIASGANCSWPSTCMALPCMMLGSCR